MAVTIQGMTSDAIEELIAQRVADALETYETNWNTRNGKKNDNGNWSGSHTDQGSGMKYATCTLLNGALTWWNSHVRTVGHDAAYEMPWKDLMKMLTKVYCPRNEIQKLEELSLLCLKMVPDEEEKVERYIWGLPDSIQVNVTSVGPVKGYTEEIVHDFEQRLETIFGRQVNRVHTLDFEGLTSDMRQDLAERLRMVYTGDDGQEVFMSHAWRRLFEIRAPLVQEFILEFFSTCRIVSGMGIDVADTLCFRLGGARCSMTWRQFILALGLHTADEMAEDGFGAYWLGSERVIPDKGDLSDYCVEISSGMDFLRGAPSYTYIRDPVQRLCHRHVEGRKSGARLSGGHFIRRLAHHFGLVSDDGLRGLSVVTRKIQLIDMGELPDVAAGDPRAAEDAPVIDEDAQADPAPVQAPQLPPPAMGRTMPQRLGRLEEEMQGLRQDVRSLCGLVERSMTDQGPRWKEIDDVGEVSTIWKSGSVGVLKSQDGCSTQSCS
ncbi:hypothetical protein Tco_1156534 [Tanacetum coccineum]